MSSAVPVDGSSPASGTGRDQIDTLLSVLDLVRSQGVRSRPELARRSGLGRTVITQRVSQLIDSGLLEAGSLGPSSGGRAPREIRFRSEGGRVLAVEIGATSIGVGLTDLAGTLTDHEQRPWNVADGPDNTLEQAEKMADDLLARQEPTSPPVWGVGVGVPGPVEFAAGKPVAPPIMPGWDGYPVRDRLAARYDVPVWVDNDVNIMALGEFRGGIARGVTNFVFVKIGSGIGAGLISGGQLHRGAKGCAGDVGHVAVTTDTSVVCRCGNIGCLEALAGGWALARDAMAAARDGRSPFLAKRSESGKVLDARDVADAASHGDPVGLELLNSAGLLVGEMLATLVNFYNPALVVIGGGVTASGDLLLAAIRQVVYRRSLPLATRDLRITRSPLDDHAGLMGASFMVIDELFLRRRLGGWLGHGSPVGLPELAAR